MPSSGPAPDTWRWTARSGGRSSQQETPTQTIGANYGGALLAAQVVEDVSITTWNPVLEIREPQPGLADTYADLYTSYRALYTNTRDITHALAARQQR